MGAGGNGNRWLLMQGVVGAGICGCTWSLAQVFLMQVVIDAGGCKCK